MTHPDMDNGWDQWSRHVLAELERLNACYERLDHNVNKLYSEVAMLKVKAGVWGVLGGIIPLAIMVVWMLLKGE